MTAAVIAASGFGIVALRTGDDQARIQVNSIRDGSQTYSNAARGVTLRYPADWKVANTVLTPNLGSSASAPYEIVALGTFPMTPADHNCAQEPVNALEAMSSTDAFVWIGERSDYPPGTLPPRPARFDPEGGTDGALVDITQEPAGCLNHPLAGSSRQFGFEDHGRSFFVTVAIGSQVTPERRAEAWQILNSLAVSPTVGPIPPSAFRPDGSIDRSQVPDFIPALDRKGDIVGYVARDEVMPKEGLQPPGGLAPLDKPQTVYSRDLKTVVGHMYPGRGFVPLGTDSNDVPPFAETPATPVG
jgi:hypothetical protein